MLGVAVALIATAAFATLRLRFDAGDSLRATEAGARIHASGSERQRSISPTFTGWLTSGYSGSLMTEPGRCRRARDHARKLGVEVGELMLTFRGLVLTYRPERFRVISGGSSGNVASSPRSTRYSLRSRGRAVRRPVSRLGAR